MAAYAEFDKYMPGRNAQGNKKRGHVGPLDFTWWRGKDLNLRPSGYEPKTVRCVSKQVKTKAIYHRHIGDSGGFFCPLFSPAFICFVRRLLEDSPLFLSSALGINYYLFLAKSHVF
jgi:hypothetical protein